MTKKNRINFLYIFAVASIDERSGGKKMQFWDKNQIYVAIKY